MSTTNNPTSITRDFSRLWHAEYSLMYLDPLICEPNLRLTGPRLGWHGTSSQVKVQQLLNRIEKQLALDSKRDEKRCFLETKGAGTRLKSDRRLQARLERIIKEYDDDTLGEHKCRKLELLQSKAEEVAALADKPDWHSLVVVECGFAHILDTPEKLAGTIQAPMRIEPQDARATIGMLTRYPARITVLGDPTLGLRADVRAFYDWTEDLNRILYAGWHPFAKVIGIYNTSSQGKPYLDVIAILFKRCPSLREVIQKSVAITSGSNTSAPGGTNSNASAAEIGLLDAIALDTKKLREKIAEFESLRHNQATDGSVSASPLSPAGSTSNANPQPSSSDRAATNTNPSPGAPANVGPSQPLAGSETASARQSLSSNPALSPPEATGTIAEKELPTIETPKSTPGNGVPDAAAPTPDAGEAPLRPAKPTPQELSFPEYRDCLLPFYHFQLICNLNGVSATALRDYASPAYGVLTTYLTEIKAIQKYLDEQGKRFHQETDITTLLPEPLIGGVRMIGRAIP